MQVDAGDEVVAVFGKDRAGRREFVKWPYGAMGEEERKAR
jgi:hypothetical protein